jgi:hypothetical protein
MEVGTSVQMGECENHERHVPDRFEKIIVLYLS